MGVFEKYFILFISFLVFLLILLVAYTISYKLGIKKALYRTTYIILSVVFAFILSPILNDEVFKLDLTKFNITLTYQEEKFNTLVDYIEEVIVHNDFLNDIYKYFPSLKDLFMDFPEVILTPITYVLLFILFLILWMPLYLYLSYKRKRRILYDREDKKSHRIWAGVIGAVQCIFLVSIVLTPINGFNRIYHSALEETLDDEYHSLCYEVESLSKYEKYCNLIEVYDSTIFAKLGGKESLNSYIFNSLTRIAYEEGYTNIANEATLIMKSSIILDQSGIFEEVANNEKGVIPLSWLVNNNLTDEDINLIIDTLRQSKYSEDLLIELRNLVVNTLDNLINEFLGYDKIVIDYSMDNETMISEIKIALKALRLLVQNDLLSQILNAKDLVVDFVDYFPEYLLDDVAVFTFVVNLVNSIDLDAFELFYYNLFDSQIFNKTIPHIIDKFLYQFGFEFVSAEGDVLARVSNFMTFARLVKKYQPKDIFSLIVSLTNDELVNLAKTFEYVLEAEETKGFIDFIVNKALKDFNCIYMSDIYSIRHWEKEVFVLRDLFAIIHEYRINGIVEVSGILNFLKNQNSQLSELIIRVIQNNVKLFIKVFLAGEEIL